MKDAEIDIDSAVFAEYTHRRMGEILRAGISVRKVESEKALVEKTKRDTMVVHFCNFGFGRCKEMNKVLDSVCHKFPGIEFVVVDAEKFPFICEKLEIRALPYLAFFARGFFVDGLVGFEGVGDDKLDAALLEEHIRAAVPADENKQRLGAGRIAPMGA